jgi:hypothetical protein
MTGAKDGDLLGHVKSKAAAAAALPVVRESTFVAFFLNSGTVTRFGVDLLSVASSAAATTAII